MFLYLLHMARKRRIRRESDHASLKAMVNSDRPVTRSEIEERINATPTNDNTPNQKQGRESAFLKLLEVKREKSASQGHSR